MSDDVDLRRRTLVLGPFAGEAAAAGAEHHVSSLVVHAFPDQIERVVQELTALEGLEIHARDVSGKLIVTLETSNDGAIVERLNAIHAIPGVLSTALVFHHVEPERG